VPAPTPTAAAIVLGWLLLQGLLYLYAPGKLVNGMPRADGSRLVYKLNGWSSWWLTWTALAALVWIGWIPPTVVADQLGPPPHRGQPRRVLSRAYLLARGGEGGGAHGTGQALYRYVVGSALDPRIGRFDFKFFCEGRPGLTGWIAINLSLAAKQYEIHGTITTPMILVNAFALLYVADYFFHEEAILTTWDIRHEKFGWMLCWGNLVWVPFTFTIQAQYLVSHPHEPSALGHGGAGRPRPGRLRDLPQRESPEAPLPAGSGGARLGPATRLHHGPERQPAVGVRLVGHGAAPELSGRPGDGTGRGACPVGSPTRCRTSTFCTPSPCSCTASGATTQCAPRSTARPGRRTAARSLADPPGHLLKWRPRPPPSPNAWNRPGAAVAVLDQALRPAIDG
jgi:hypothetical protein